MNLFVQGLPPPLVLAAGVIFLLMGGKWLVDGSVAIAARMGVSTLVIGLTFVAFGTSAPELFLNIIAAIRDNTDLSFGNVIGSNIANVGLVIGIGALVSPLNVNSRVIEKELPWLLIVSFGVLGMAAVPPVDRWFDGESGGHGFFRLDGVIMLGVFLLLTFMWYRMGRKDAADPLATEVSEHAEGTAQVPFTLAWVMFFGGLSGLLGGGHLAEMGAVNLASELGMSESMIGLTVVAVATSLPEMATVVIAARKGHADLAVGNIVGSNIFNLLLVLATTALVAEVPVPEHGWSDLWMMLFFTILLWVLAINSKKRRINRREGAIILVLYVVFFVWTVQRELASRKAASQQQQEQVDQTGI